MLLDKFYVVQKNGTAAIWQTAPERLENLLKHKAGYTIASPVPSNTRAEALVKLRQLFPGSRPARQKN